MMHIKKQEVIAAILVGAGWGLAQSVLNLIDAKRKARDREEELQAIMEAKKIADRATLGMEQEFKENIDRLLERYEKEGDDMVESLKKSFEPFRLTEKTEGTGTENEEA